MEGIERNIGMSFLSLMAVVAIVFVAGAFSHTSKIKTALQKHASVSHYLPKAVTALILTAQVSELVRVVEHVSIVNFTAALLLLAIVVATKSGTEGEIN